MSFRHRARFLASRFLQTILRVRAQPLLRTLPRGPVLIVAPHPDDEALGCGRLIVALRNSGVQVDLVWLTDGEASQPDFAGGAVALGAVRRAEARAAGAILGVSDDRLHHLGAPDGLLPHLPPAKRHELVNSLVRLIETLRPATIFVTSSLDGSTEHTAAHALVEDARKSAGHRAELRTYLVWAHWKIRHLWTITWRAPSVAFLPTTPSSAATWNRAVQVHRTQVLAQSSAHEAILSPHFLACFPRCGEFFFSI